MSKITQFNEQLFRRAFENEFNHLSGNTLVALGSGDGKYAVKLGKLAHAQKIICIDHDKTLLEKASQRGCQIIQADLNNKITLPSNSADIVIANQVIEHIAKTDVVVKEAYRILKPGGTALWCTPNLASWHNIIALMLGYQPFSSQISDEALPWQSLTSPKQR